MNDEGKDEGMGRRKGGVMKRGRKRDEGRGRKV